MGAILHFKSLYVEAFENCEPKYLVIFLKVYSAFCAIMLSMACYAFIYRVANNFNF